MTAIRATFFFEQGKYGWSESLHNTSSGLQNVMDQAVALAAKRVKMLPEFCQLSYIRVSDDEQERDTIVRNVTPPNFDAAVSASASAFTACLLRLEASPTRRRLMYMRPAALSEGANSDPVIDDPSWLIGFTAWAALVSSAPWAVKYTEASGAKVPINQLSQNIDLLNVGVSSTAGFTAGDRVYIGKLPAGKSAMGYYKVRNVIDATSMYVQSYRGPNIDVGAGGYIQKRVTGLAAIQTVIKLRVTSRKTGRPFDSPHGRSRTVR